MKRFLWYVSSVPLLISTKLAQKSGVLYCRPHFRYTFEKFHFILAWDNLLYYDFHSRYISGRAIPCIHHKRRGIIRLHDCYAYSGSVADDLTYPANAWYKAAADSGS